MKIKLEIKGKAIFPTHAGGCGIFPLNLNVGRDGGDWSPETPPKEKKHSTLIEQASGRATETTRVAPWRSKQSLASLDNRTASVRPSVSSRVPID